MENDEMELQEDEPQEDDYYMYDAGALGCKTAVSQDGRLLDIFNTRDEAETFIRNRRELEKFWPNVWYVSDHGNYHLVIL